MRAAAFVLAASLLPTAAAPAAGPVAVVAGVEIAGEALAGREGRARVLRLAELLWERLMHHYAAEHGLAATAEEIAELGAYDAEFRRRDREQRARKLAELEQRLRDGALEAEQRRFAEAFRAVLARMAARDAEADAAPAAADAAEAAAAAAHRIASWKVNRALYARYGGAVALTPSGPDPYGARARLFADYERRGLLEVRDAALRAALHELLAEATGIALPADRVDFTPYWRRPLTGSYYAQ
jgi:hypothetical protein